MSSSGVGEPSQIAPLFDLCDDQHDHEQEHKDGPQLAEVMVTISIMIISIIRLQDWTPVSLSLMGRSSTKTWIV